MISSSGHAARCVVLAQDQLVERRLERLGEGDVGVELLAERGVGVGVDLGDRLGQRRAVHAVVLAGVDHPDADGVADDVDGGVVGEAGVLVFLVLGVVGDRDALTGELALGQRAHAAEDVGDRLARVGEELLAVGAVLGVPLVADGGEVVHQQLGEERQVGGAALGDRRRGVVGEGALRRRRRR